MDASWRRGVAPVRERCCERVVTMELRWFFDGSSMDVRRNLALFALPHPPLGLPNGVPPRSPGLVLTAWVWPLSKRNDIFVPFQSSADILSALAATLTARNRPTSPADLSPQA